MQLNHDMAALAREPHHHLLRSSERARTRLLHNKSPIMRARGSSPQASVTKEHTQGCCINMQQRTRSSRVSGMQGEPPPPTQGHARTPTGERQCAPGGGTPQPQEARKGPTPRQGASTGRAPQGECKTSACATFDLNQSAAVHKHERPPADCALNRSHQIDNPRGHQGKHCPCIAGNHRTGPCHQQSRASTRRSNHCDRDPGSRACSPSVAGNQHIAPCHRHGHMRTAGISPAPLGRHCETPAREHPRASSSSGTWVPEEEQPAIA
jgi:hypothetical protein